MRDASRPSVWPVASTTYHSRWASPVSLVSQKLFCVVIMAASDNQISIRVTVLTEDDLRDAAFAVVDSILNSIEWPADIE